MKNILKTFGLLLLSGTAFVACDDYLDRQPDEQLTAAQIFQKAKTTEQYLTNVYGYQSNYSDPSGQILPWSCCDDDGSIVFTGRNYSLINYDTWNPNNDIYRSQTYNNLYKGIREANYFMQHVFECPEMSEIDKGYHYNEARFLRAYYYSLLMSAYGPVFLIGDDPVDFTQEGLNERERNTWEECINYVANELWETSKGLPDVWTGETANYGRATKGAALAIRSRMLLYSARKLFNGNDLYKGVIDKYGNPLFPTVYDEKKWETAAQAAKDVIDLNIYGLIGADGTDPYTSMHDLYTKVGPVNGVTERIFSYLVTAYNWGVSTTPRAARTRAYGSYGPTQKLVDAFAMANGRYPITGYTNGDQAQPIIDPESGYSETGFSTFTHPIYGDELKNTFMMYLPRLCEHCLNPACVATCPSGAIYKREEDGIVLIDQDKCRGWRMCITGCPYKKIYFNWKSGKSEKCIFCYPRIEAGMPTVCSESCVGRIRYLGVLLYDADAIENAASTENEKDLYQRQLDVFLDPNDPKVIEQALKDGIPQSVIDAAQQSPVYKMAMDWKLALPLHPEYRTLPMVWYVPPLSPIQSAADAGELGSNGILPDVESLRIPVQYLANLLTAGDTQPVLLALKRMLAMRHFKRAETVDGVTDTRALEEVGLTEAQAQEMYRYLAIANYEDRFVVPSSHRELAREAFPEKNGCGFTFGDGCHGSDSKFNLFNSRRIDAMDVTSKTEPHS